LLNLCLYSFTEDFFEFLVNRVDLTGVIDVGEGLRCLVVYEDPRLFPD